MNTSTAVDPGAVEIFPSSTDLVLALFLAVALAAPVSFGLLRLYRRAVLKSMGTRANSRPNEPVLPEASTPLGQPVRTRLDISVLDHASSVPAGPGDESLYSNLLRAPWRAAAIYALAGSCLAAIVVAPVVFFLPDTELTRMVQIGAPELTLLPVRFLFLFWIHAWPVVLTVNLLAATTRRAKLATASVYFLVMAALGLIGVALSPTFGWDQIVLHWLNINLLGTVLLLAFLNRRVRAVGPLVLIFIVLAVLFGPAWAFGSTVPPFVGLSILILGFGVGGLVGWLILRWIRARYERKKLSDQSITLDAIWLLFGFTQSIPLVLVYKGTAWILSGLLAFVVYKLVAWAGFSLLDHEASPARRSTRLLLLRVFSLGKRSERLFDAFAKHWRHVGSIQLIAGPDLATTTVEPHEFFDFLSGKLARRFIDGPKTLDLRLSEMDLEPDEDGRFRVNDFFCHDDTWRMVLSRLADESDAVLMDLRGFSPQNSGVIFEISTLINEVPLERVVFVIDETTDEQFLLQTAQRAWERMESSSPNRSSTSGQLRLFRVTGAHGTELRGLLRALCDAAKSTTPVGDSLSTENRVPGNEPATVSLSWRQIGRILLLAALISFLSLLMSPFYVQPGAIQATFAITLIVLLSLATFPLGYWTGHAWPGRHVTSYIILGISVGLIEWFGVLIYRLIFFGIEGLTTSLTTRVPVFLLMRSVISIALIFISGALCGDLIERRRFSAEAGWWVAVLGVIGALVGLFATIIGALSV
jgi:hypothetical protein